MKRKKQNSKSYKYVREVGKVARKCAIKAVRAGAGGTFLEKQISKGIENLIKKPVHKVSYEITGIVYDKKHDSATKGSLIYTLVNILIVIMLFGLIIPAVFAILRYIF